MATFFAFAESREGALRKVAFEMVTAARQAADAAGGGEVHALLLGGPGIAARAEELGRHGADVVAVGPRSSPLRRRVAISPRVWPRDSA
jgi:electron transfer flavoprotein alpha subunit